MLFNWSHRIAVALGFQGCLLQVLEKKSCLSEATSQTRVRNIENKKEMNKEETSLTETSWDPMHLLHSPIWLKLHNNIYSFYDDGNWAQERPNCAWWKMYSVWHELSTALFTSEDKDYFFLLCSSCTCFIFFFLSAAPQLRYNFGQNKCKSLVTAANFSSSSSSFRILVSLYF